MRYGKGFIGLFTVLFLLAAVIFGKSEYAWDGTVGITAQVTVSEGTEKIRCWAEDDDEFYLFLPGYADLSEVRLQSNVSNTVYLDGRELTEGMDCSWVQLDVPYDLCYVARGGKEYHYSLTFLQSADLPTLYIDTASGSMEQIHSAKDKEEPGTLRLYTPEGELDHKGNLEKIKGRGNSTWECEKKPYNLTLSTEGDLLGMGAARRWILLANALDASNLKNKIAYDLARDAGLAYTPQCEWVDLYLNGEYAGLYLLCERNEVHRERVDISEEGSFLVAKDWQWRLKSNGDPFVMTQANTALRIHYSDFSETELLDILQSAENAILAEDGIDPVTGKHWRELIDLDSWAKKYLVEEVLGNVDASTLSQFYYYDGSDGTGKIYAGPIWDMDLTMQNTDVPWLEQEELFYGVKPGVYGSDWIPALYDDAEFYSRVTQLYEEIFLPLLEQLLDGGIEAYGAKIQTASQLNQIRWQTRTLADGEEAIRTFLMDRVAFLNRIWVEKEDYVIVTVKEYDGTKTSFAHQPGTPLSQLPVYESDDTVCFYGWFHHGIGTPFDPEEPVNENIHIEIWWNNIAQPEDADAGQEN